jgi:hypothetical protein
MEIIYNKLELLFTSKGMEFRFPIVDLNRYQVEKLFTANNSEEIRIRNNYLEHTFNINLKRSADDEKSNKSYKLYHDTIRKMYDDAVPVVNKFYKRELNITEDKKLAHRP